MVVSHSRDDEHYISSRQTCSVIHCDRRGRIMMLRIISICLLIIFCHEISGLRRRCLNTGVLFPDKISRSPMIVYGESLAKRIYVETEMELLFNVTFRVDCILKGERIEHRIEITNAGILENRTACQWLDPGKSYVVFLDKCQANESVYCPMDFQERLVDDITYELLEKTCYLTRTPPLNSIASNCPNVSMAEFCSNEEIVVKILPKSKTFDDLSRNRSFVNHFADNPHSRADLSSSRSLGMLILAVYLSMYI